MLKSRILTKCLRQLSSQSIVPNICIVGAGPAGFYAAQQILKVCAFPSINFMLYNLTL